ncbi:MmcQ/YjbR family DNA-binding protein [Kordiimonas sp.]|uniref:MmcQ/YjbR family DNA-binding protein n=1 Tax=Kordiimonas sp. TaxID=1970157 RepID=UPI003A955527
MTRDEFDAYCATLKATTHVVQWGGASVWKVGGKIFAICSNWGPDDKRSGTQDSASRISFKCSDLSYQILCELEGIEPAPYLARAKWVQLQRAGALTHVDLKSYIADAHAIIAAKLTKKLQRDLGLAA